MTPYSLHIPWSVCTFVQGVSYSTGQHAMGQQLDTFCISEISIWFLSGYSIEPSSNRLFFWLPFWLRVLHLTALACKEPWLGGSTATAVLFTQDGFFVPPQPWHCVSVTFVLGLRCRGTRFSTPWMWLVRSWCFAMPASLFLKGHKTSISTWFQRLRAPSLDGDLVRLRFFNCSSLVFRACCCVALPSYSVLWSSLSLWIFIMSKGTGIPLLCLLEFMAFFKN